MTIFTAGDGNTPLSPDEQADLIPNLATKEELNEFERANILVAYDWALAPRNIRRQDPLTEPYTSRSAPSDVRYETWKWAGLYRATEKNIGIPHFQIRESLGVLLGDARYWLEHQTFPPDEIAIRFHHRLVSIHPFANGNGRQKAPMADVLAKNRTCLCLPGEVQTSWNMEIFAAAISMLFEPPTKTK